MVKSESTRLQKFFAIIRDAYHTDNPYHNFYHAMHVVQVCEHSWDYFCCYCINATALMWRSASMQ